MVGVDVVCVRMTMGVGGSGGRMEGVERRQVPGKIVQTKLWLQCSCNGTPPLILHPDLWSSDALKLD